jgi:hypothetical protein
MYYRSSDKYMINHISAGIVHVTFVWEYLYFSVHFSKQYMQYVGQFGLNRLVHVT